MLQSILSGFRELFILETNKCKIFEKKEEILSMILVRKTKDLDNERYMRLRVTPGFL